MLATKNFIKAELQHFILHKASVSLSAQVSRLRVFLNSTIELMFSTMHFFSVKVIIHTYHGSLRAFYACNMAVSWFFFGFKVRF